MSYQIIKPCEELKGFVSHFWASSWNNIGKQGSTYFSTANIQTELAFAFYTLPGNRRPELLFSTILGHTEMFRQFPMNGNLDMFGVSLFSHAVPCFFDVYTPELTNQVVSLDDLLGDKGKAINEKMTNAITVQKRVEIISRYFKMQLIKGRFEDPIIINAIKQIRKSQGITNITELASEFCLSGKQFERRFAEYSGFNPKLYARIIRFEAALWNRRKYSTLTQLAHDYGYYDQAHFIHDFKMFSGFSPNKFFSITGY